MSRMTETLSEPMPPAAVSVALAVSRLFPSCNTTPGAVNEVPCRVAITPPTVTIALGSLTLPVTVTGVLENNCSGVGVAICTAIGNEYTTVRVEVAVFPATSVAVIGTLLLPGTNPAVQENVEFVTVAAIPLQVTLATPDSPSETIPWSVTWLVLTLLLFKGVMILMSGGVSSNLTVDKAVAEKPATSVTNPEAD